MLYAAPDSVQEGSAEAVPRRRADRLRQHDRQPGLQRAQGQLQGTDSPELSAGKLYLILLGLEILETNHKQLLAVGSCQV